MYSKNSFYNFDYIISPSEIVSEQLKFLVGRKTKILNKIIKFVKNGYFTENIERYYGVYEIR